MLDKLVRYCGVGMDRIAVLSPYRAQCHVIREDLINRELSGVPVISIVKSQGRACYVLKQRLGKLTTRLHPSGEQTYTVNQKDLF